MSDMRRFLAQHPELGELEARADAMARHPSSRPVPPRDPMVRPAGRHRARISLDCRDLNHAACDAVDCACDCHDRLDVVGRVIDVVCLLLLAASVVVPFWVWLGGW